MRWSRLQTKLSLLLWTQSRISIAIIVKHLAGNMRSRWTDFLSTDGEKPDRNRDAEFESPPKTRAELMALWEAGWKHVFDALALLTDDRHCRNHQAGAGLRGYKRDMVAGTSPGRARCAIRSRPAADSQNVVEKTQSCEQHDYLKRTTSVLVVTSNRR